MIIDIPFIYQAQIVPPGKRNAQKAEIRDVVSVSVTEVGHDEAAIVAWWTPPDCPDSDQVALRHFEGKLYLPMTLPGPSDRRHGAPAKPSRDANSCRRLSDKSLPGTLYPVIKGETFADLWAKGEASFDRTILVASKRNDKDVPTLDQVPHRRVASSSREVQIQAHHAFASELLMIGGTTYRTVPEPVLRIETDHNYVRVQGGYSNTDYRSPALNYRLDRWSDAQETWKSLIEDLGHWEKGYAKARNVPYQFKSVHPPEVLRPDLLALDDVKHAVRGVADRLIHTLSRVDYGGYSSYRGLPRIASYDREVALCFARLRDTLSGGAGTEEIVGRLRDYAERTQSIGQLRTEHDEVAQLLTRIEREPSLAADNGRPAP